MTKPWDIDEPYDELGEGSKPSSRWIRHRVIFLHIQGKIVDSTQSYKKLRAKIAAHFDTTVRTVREDLALFQELGLIEIDKKADTVKWIGKEGKE